LISKDYPKSASAAVRARTARRDRWSTVTARRLVAPMSGCRPAQPKNVDGCLRTARGNQAPKSATESDRLAVVVERTVAGLFDELFEVRQEGLGSGENGRDGTRLAGRMGDELGDRLRLAIQPTD
jgi:hypothetical protein